MKKMDTFGVPEKMNTFNEIAKMNIFVKPLNPIPSVKYRSAKVVERNAQ